MEENWFTRRRIPKRLMHLLRYHQKLDLTINPFELSVQLMSKVLIALVNLPHLRSFGMLWRRILY